MTRQRTRRGRCWRWAAAAGAAAAAGEPSARLNYENPVQKPIQTWFNSVTPTHAPGSVFFATNGHSTGVMGLKQLATQDGRFEGTAVFSVSKEGHPAELVECGPRAHCSNEGVPGLNAQLEAKIDLDEWSTETSYDFLVRARPVRTGVARYEGYVHAPELQGWQLLAKIDAAIGDRAWTLEDLYSYVRPLQPPAGEEQPIGVPEAPAWGRFGPSFVEPQQQPGDWGQVVSASLVIQADSGFQPTVTRLHANITGGGRTWGLGLDGQPAVREAQGPRLEVALLGALPQALVEFSAWEAGGQGSSGEAEAQGDAGLAWLRWEYLVVTILATGLSCYCCTLLVIHECGGPGGLLGSCLAQPEPVPGTALLPPSALRSVAHWPLGSCVEAYASSTVEVAASLGGLARAVLGPPTVSAPDGGKYSAVSRGG